MANGYAERFLTAEDGLRLYYRDYGDTNTRKTPILCLAGLTRNAKDFDALARDLGAERRVLCPDYRGRGRSECDPDWRHYRLETTLNDIRHLLAATNVHRVVVIGTSFGGIIGMAMAAAFPTALAGLVLNDIGPELDPAGLGHILSYVKVDRPQSDLDSAVASLKEWLPELSFRHPETWRIFAQNTYRLGEDGMWHFDWDVAVVKPLLAQAGAAHDLWALFRALRNTPVLAFRGEHSSILSQECFDRMAEIKSDLVRVSVACTGHAPALDEAEVRKGLDDFLTRL